MPRITVSELVEGDFLFECELCHRTFDFAQAATHGASHRIEVTGEIHTESGEIENQGEGQDQNLKPIEHVTVQIFETNPGLLNGSQTIVLNRGSNSNLTPKSKSRFQKAKDFNLTQFISPKSHVISRNNKGKNLNGATGNSKSRFGPLSRQLRRLQPGILKKSLENQVQNQARRERRALSESLEGSYQAAEKVDNFDLDIRPSSAPAPISGHSDDDNANLGETSSYWPNSTNEIFQAREISESVTSFVSEASPAKTNGCVIS